jgi:hypothetical protein
MPTGTPRHGIIYATGFAGQICTKCDELKELSEFYKSISKVSGIAPECSSCTRKFQQTTRTHRSVQNDSLKKRYGITADEFDRLLKTQNMGCAICKTTNPGRKNFGVDHNHETGEVRGLLCTKCNTGLGALGDSVKTLESAIEYLKNRGQYGNV